jgi:dihydroorotate dehydrogenase electron transfer subunit
MVKANEGTDPLLRRPFSIFQIVRDTSGQPNGFTLLNKRIGRGTHLLFCAPPGLRVACLGPLGRPFEPPEGSGDARGEAWMVAGGVGLAPFATLAQALRDRGTPMKLFYGARRAGELFFVDEFASLGAEIILTTEDGSRGTRGLITAPLEAALRSPAAAHARVYACGPTPMMRAVAELTARHRRPCAVSLEQVMGCGLGGCYSCVVSVRRNGGSHYVRSCVEGPVFDAQDIVWQELAH